MAPGVDTPQWNPRYVAYAKSKGNSPDEQLAKDTDEFPGGCMVSFSIWIRSKWAEWHKAIGEHKEIHTKADHAAFDKWLGI